MDMNKSFSSFVAWKQLDRREDKGIRERGIRRQSIRFNQMEKSGREVEVWTGYSLDQMRQDRIRE